MLAFDHLGLFGACDKVGNFGRIPGRGKVGHDKLSVLVAVLDLRAVKLVNGVFFFGFEGSRSQECDEPVSAQSE